MIAHRHNMLSLSVSLSVSLSESVGVSPLPLPLPLPLKTSLPRGAETSRSLTGEAGGWGLPASGWEARR